MATGQSEMMWHNDGHILHLQINKAELKIVQVTCPNAEKQDGACQIPHIGCVVSEFAFRYGLDCNAGVCPATENMEICWTSVGSQTDIDSMQLWFMPVNDDVFGAWLNTKTPELPA
jgi:hypothetical protein